MKKIIEKITNWAKKQLCRLFMKASHIHLPGFYGQSLYDVGKIFFTGISKGFIADRAASTAFSFFTALFPLLLFVFTLIPYVPIDNFQADLLLYFQKIIPQPIWEILNDTITYIITHKSGNLLSVSIFLSLYLGTNGINSMFNAFDQTYHHFTNTSTWLKKRWHALVILSSIFLIIIITIGLFGFGDTIINKLVEIDFITSQFFYYVFQIGCIVWGLFNIVFAIAMLYYFGSSKIRKFRVFSPGSIISAALIVITTLGFGYYITNFSRYNILYGSLGTILILTFYLYINCMFLLIGFEMNTSIQEARKNDIKRQKNQASLEENM